MIDLWTSHAPDFDLLSGRVDHSKSSYYNETKGVKKNYPKLWKQIDRPEGQIIWCFTSPPKENEKTGEPKVLWELRVPYNRIVCFIDEIVWNRILSIQCDVGKKLRNQWHIEALERSPDDIYSYIKRLEDEFWNRKPKSGSWWDELFVDEPGECIDATIDHPVSENNVLNKNAWGL